MRRPLRSIPWPPVEQLAELRAIYPPAKESLGVLAIELELVDRP